MAHLSSSSHAHHGAQGLPYSRPSTPGPQPLQLGFVGLGAMGYPMAKNLATSQHPHTGPHPLLVWNRSRAKSEQLQQELGKDKIRIADTPEQVAKECDVVLTSLANDAIVKSIYAQFNKALSEIKHEKVKIFVETSTSYPTLVGELDELIHSFPHTHLITCPVFGPPIAAEKAQLVLVMAGDYRAKQRVAYLLIPSVGRKVIDLGGDLRKAPTLKLIGNSLILGCIEVMAESITMGEKANIDTDVVLGVIKDLFPNTPMANYGAKITRDEFDGSKGFNIDGGIKDATHIRKLTAEHNAPMPIIDIAHQHMLTARAIHQNQQIRGTQKYDVLDWSALVAGPRVAAGLDGLNSGKHLKVEKEE